MPVGVVSESGVLVSVRGVASALGGVASVPGGVVSEAGVLVSVRGVASVPGGVAYALGAGALYWEAWPLHFSGPLCRGAEWVLCNLPVSQKEGGIPSVSGTREAQASAVRAFSQERSGLFLNM